ncbi:SRPBCC domain-containing protein [Flavobacterium suzhouense]|uniref:SRPBCC domain-containing protein n=1 Tax=Flavobacterium suzhouense TaxID=1529638 RepID=A0ABW5NU19_9FLAO
MERKTKVSAEEGKRDLFITRDFDLPVALLFMAYEKPKIVEQWMGTKALKYDAQKHGSYQFQTKGPDGDVVFRANGTFHDVVPNERIVRTFEMENAGFGVQIEFLEFEALTENSSRLVAHVVYKSVEFRDANLKLPFAWGINMAHDRLEEIVSKL